MKKRIDKQAVSVYSEIGKLREVVVQRPGMELENFDVSQEADFLMDGDLDSDTAGKEHDEFVSILEKNNVKVYYFENLFVEAWNVVDKKIKEKFIRAFVKEAQILNKSLISPIRKFLSGLTGKVLVRKLIEGIPESDIKAFSTAKTFVTKPLANIYFQRDNFSSIGSCISINKMKYTIRQRENLLSELVFKYHPKFVGTKFVYSRAYKNTIEGGDIFPYSEDTLVIGISERTNLNAVSHLARNLKTNQDKFKRIICINVPKVGRLMHLDTWLTMLDYDKFLYSPNAVKDFKFWEVDFKSPSLKPKEIKNTDLEGIIKMIIGKKPTLIPVANNNSTIDVDRETKYDGTNYLVLSPGVVVGYKRNKYTNEALRNAGIKVFEFEGNELSLGEGNARCMSMPIYRDPIKKFHSYVIKG